MRRKRSILKFSRENTLKEKVPNKPGIYRFLNKKKTRNGKIKTKTLYVGHAKHLRHRLQSYRQKDCFDEHPTKRSLRKKITHFSFTVMPKEKAKKIERSTKNRNGYNHL